MRREPPASIPPPWRVPGQGGRSRGTRLSWRSAFLAGGCLTLALGLGSYAASRYRLGVDLQAHGCLDGTRLYLIDTFAGAEDVRQGDLVAFRAQGIGVPVFEGQWFVKRAAGVPGDWVTVDPLHTRINGMCLADGLALAATLKQDLTAFLRHERVPVEHFWMLGETPDSFDSRYWGFLPQTQVVGKAYALF